MNWGYDYESVEMIQKCGRPQWKWNKKRERSSEKTCFECVINDWECWKMTGKFLSLLSWGFASCLLPARQKGRRNKAHRELIGRVWKRCFDGAPFGAFRCALLLRAINLIYFYFRVRCSGGGSGGSSSAWNRMRIKIELFMHKRRIKSKYGDVDAVSSRWCLAEKMLNTDYS